MHVIPLKTETATTSDMGMISHFSLVAKSVADFWHKTMWYWWNAQDVDILADSHNLCLYKDAEYTE